jgi:hypothetical protein
LGVDEYRLVDAATGFIAGPLGARGVTIVAEEGQAGDALATIAVDKLSRRPLLLDIQRFPPRAVDLSALADQVKAKGSQAILFWGDAEQAAVLRESLPAPAPALVFLGDGYRLSRLAGLGTATLYYLTSVAPIGEVRLPDDFTSRYGGPAQFNAVAGLGYLSTGESLFLASQAGDGGRVDRASVARALESRRYTGLAPARAYIFRLDGNIYPGQLEQ